MSFQNARAATPPRNWPKRPGSSAARSPKRPLSKIKKRFFPVPAPRRQQPAARDASPASGGERRSRRPQAGGPRGRPGGRRGGSACRVAAGRDAPQGAFARSTKRKRRASPSTKRAAFITASGAARAAIRSSFCRKSKGSTLSKPSNVCRRWRASRCPEARPAAPEERPSPRRPPDPRRSRSSSPRRRRRVLSGAIPALAGRPRIRPAPRPRCRDAPSLGHRLRARRLDDAPRLGQARRLSRRPVGRFRARAAERRGPAASMTVSADG
jgi:hypothetical protein